MVQLKKKKRFLEQSFGLCGRGRGWDDLGEWHWNTYNTIYVTSGQSRFDAWYWMLGASALGWPRGMVWGGRREEGSGWGTHVYLWWINFDIWQNQYNIVKFKNKIKFKKKKERTAYGLLCLQSKTSGLALPGYLVESWPIRAPKQGAIHTLGSIQLQLKSKEANS